MYQVCLSTCNARPADTAKMRKIEINFQSQIQILEHGSYASPGSREDEFSLTLCRSQLRLATSQFSGATQQAIGNALIGLMDKRAQSKEPLTIKKVIESIRTMHVMII